MSEIIENGASANEKQTEEVSSPTFAERSLGSTKVWRLRAKIDFNNFEKRLLQHQLQLKENDVAKTISKQLHVRDRWAALRSSRTFSKGTHRELKQILKETMHFRVGDGLPTEIYCCNWHKWQDPISTKMLALIIARAKQPLILTAKDFVNYDMELFVKMVKTAYSLYTLLKD